MPVLDKINLLKEEYDGVFNLSQELRLMLGEDNSILSGLINAASALVKFHWEEVGKTFIPKLAFQLKEAHADYYSLELKVVNGSPESHKTLIMSFNKDDSLIEFETNYTY